MKGDALDPKVEILLREACGEDEAFLKRLFFELHQGDADDWPGLTEGQRTGLLELQFRAQREQYSAMFPGAEHSLILFGGEPAGRLLVDRTSVEIYIIDLAVSREFRNRGIGTVILRKLLDESATAGRRVAFRVEKTNPAIKLYERLGLKIVSDEGLHWKMESRPDFDPEEGN